MGPCDVLTMWIKGGVRKIRLFCRLGFLRFSLCFIKWFLHLLHFFQILFFPFLFKIFLRLSTKKIVSIKKSVLMMQWILKDQIKVVWCAKYIPILIVYYILFLLLFFFLLRFESIIWERYFWHNYKTNFHVKGEDICQSMHSYFKTTV